MAQQHAAAAHNSVRNTQPLNLHHNCLNTHARLNASSMVAGASTGNRLSWKTAAGLLKLANLILQTNARCNPTHLRCASLPLPSACTSVGSSGVAGCFPCLVWQARAAVACCRDRRREKEQQTTGETDQLSKQPFCPLRPHARLAAHPNPTLASNHLHLAPQLTGCTRGCCGSRWLGEPHA